ncbi:non-ribosomal peptide synthetase [Puia dinghuensis]|uniref:Carrier domain-containing protein n=1 Tax=Puia dinghuensis TaxID=1792502 RepID=A0A8J2XMT6_9BACT|nr:non-ribosomal peptide synthetase [Puia dinghuensis]GGA81048.1 hypothetical protein GCM10011511_00030 [Puia dinghuensis]
MTTLETVELHDSAICSYQFSLDNSSLNIVRRYADARDLEIFIQMLSVLAVLTAKTTNANHSILGIPLLLEQKRPAKIENSLIPIKITFNPEDTIKEIILRTAKILQSVYQRVTRITSRTGDADAAESLQPENSCISFPGLHHPQTSIGNSSLSYIVHNDADNISIEMLYQSSRYSEKQIKTLAGYFITIFHEFDHLDKKYRDIGYLSDQEISIQLTVFNGTNFKVPDISAIRLFQQRVRICGDRTAIICGSRTITYKELYQRSAKLATWLHLKTGIKQGDVVAHRLSPSIESIITLLGTWMVTGIYLPMPGELSIDLFDIVKQVNPAIIIDDSLIDEILSPSSEEDVFSEFPSYNPDQIACILYTSGWTGPSRGVFIKQAGLLNSILDVIRELEIDQSDVYLQCLGSSSVDAVRENLVALLSGATLLMMPSEASNDDVPLVKIIRENKVTVLTLTPSSIKALNREDISPVRALLSTGSRAPTKDLTFYSKRLKAFNLYSITENSGVTAAFALTADKDYPDGIPLGKPMPNTRLFILDNSNNLLPVGVFGEIGISGPGLAPAYLEDGLMESSSFIDRRLSSQPIYKSGDIGKWNEDGTLSFLNRREEQFLITAAGLDELQNKTLRHPAVKDAIYLSDNAQKIYCFFESVARHPDRSAISTRLEKDIRPRIPPSKWICLEKIPVTRRGKPDNAKLQDLIKKKTWLDEIDPHSEEAIVLTDALKKLFENNNITLDDNFFDLGGDSLKAIALSAYLSNKGYKCQVGQILETPLLKEIVGSLKKSGPDKDQRIRRIERSAYHPVSHAQRRMWALSHLIETEKYTCNVPSAWLIEGGLSISNLGKAFEALLQRHEILRTTFKTVGNNVVQVIRDLNSSLYDFMYYEDAKKVDERFADEISSLFDLENGPLLRLRVYRTQDRKHIVLLVAHHIIMDAWSCKIFYNELLTLYTSLLKNETPLLPQLEFQYKDYAGWQNRLLQEKEFDSHREFWLSILEKSPLELAIPTDYKRNKTRSFKGDTLKLRFSPEHSLLLEELMGKYNLTPYTVFTALTNILLYRYTNAPVIVTGTPFSNRETPGLENHIGFFINMLPVCIPIEGKDKVLDYLFKVRHLINRIHDHRAYPSDVLIDELKLQTAQSPLFNIVITWLDRYTEPELVQLNEIKVCPYPIRNTTSKYDLTFGFTRSQDGSFEAEINYNTDLFLQSRIERMLEHLRELVKKIDLFDTHSIGQIDILPDVEKKKILDFNDTGLEEPEAGNVVQQFKTLVQKYPGNIALYSNGTSYSFSDLQRSTCRCAAYLREEKKLKKQARVGVMMNTSFSYVTTIIGILKANAVYVPIDRNDPAERIDLILRDADINVMITDSKAFDKNISVPIDIICFEDIDNYTETDVPDIDILPNDLAYIIYTSGTTGQPKGVAIEHFSLWNFCAFHNKVYNIGSQHSSMLYSSITFDASIWELFPYLVAGSCLYPLPAESKLDIPAISNFICHHRITHCFLPPAILDLLLTRNENDHLKQVILHTGGERIKENEKIEEYTIVNNYGLTETTVIATSTCGVKIRCSNRPLTIGKPFAWSKIYILDNELKMQPIGVTGEICISGNSLASGYTNDPQLEMQKFIDSPYGKGKLFRTGDYGYWTSEGEIVFAGRRDKQVQLNGRRVELEEIERVLLQFTGIDQAVADMRQWAESNILVAYYTSHDPIDPADLKKHAASYLPKQIVPAYFYRLDSIPLAASGKTDYKLLPDISFERSGNTSECKDPNSPVRSYLKAIVGETLKLESVGFDISFFDLGANSISLINMHEKIRSRYPGVRITDLFTHYNIDSLADFIGNDPTGETKQIRITAENAIRFEKNIRSKSTLYRNHYEVFIEDLPTLHRISVKYAIDIDNLLISGLLYALNLCSPENVISLFVLEGRTNSISIYKVDFGDIANEESLFRIVHDQSLKVSSAETSLIDINHVEFVRTEDDRMNACLIMHREEGALETTVQTKFDLVMQLRPLDNEVYKCTLMALGDPGKSIIEPLSGHIANVFRSMKNSPV